MVTGIVVYFLNFFSGKSKNQKVASCIWIICLESLGSFERALSTGMVFWINPCKYVTKDFGILSSLCRLAFPVFWIIHCLVSINKCFIGVRSCSARGEKTINRRISNTLGCSSTRLETCELYWVETLKSAELKNKNRKLSPIGIFMDRILRRPCLKHIQGSLNESIFS